MTNDHSPLFEPPAADPDERVAVVKPALDGAPGFALEGEHDRRKARAPEAGSATVARAAGRRRRSSTPPASSGLPAQRTRPQWLQRLARYRRQMERDMDLELGVAELRRAPEPLLDRVPRGWRRAAGRGGRALLSSGRRRPRPSPATCRDCWSTPASCACRSCGCTGGSRRSTSAFEFGDRIYSLKPGFDEPRKQVVPGLMLRLPRSICFERGLRANELLGGDMPWKRNFSWSEREHSPCQLLPRAHEGGLRRLSPALARVRGGVGARLRSPAGG